MDHIAILLKLEGLLLNFVRAIFTSLGIWIWVLMLSGCQDKRTPDLIIIPNGYIGWVRVNYNVTNATPVKISNGYRVFQIPSNGVLSTKSSVQAGWGQDKYIYQAGNAAKPLKRTLKGGGGMIWQVTNGESNGQTYRKFFVGPETAWRAAVQSKNTPIVAQ